MVTEQFSVLAYVDDFCGVSPTKVEAQTAFNRFHTLTEELGLKLAPDKTCSPDTTMEWLGFQFDSNDMSITIPQVKLDDLLLEAETMLHRQNATKQQIQSVAGRLNHISLCVRPARRFMGRILATLRQAHQEVSVPITDEFKKDVRRFCEYARQTNRRILIEPKLPVLTLECDACLQGAGGFSHSNYYQLSFPDTMTETHHISQLEAWIWSWQPRPLSPKPSHTPGS